MRLRELALLTGVAGAAALAYGYLWESRRVVVTRRTLALPGWPEHLRGYRLVQLADFHVQDERSLRVAKQAVAFALEEAPDMIAITGDFVERWKLDSARMVGDLLEPLLLMNGAVVAIPGNHEYTNGDPELLSPILDELNIKFLRNESWKHGGITWVGVDSFNEQRADPHLAMKDVEGPAIALWHEPDLVWLLPKGCALQLSGHSHGGQFKIPPGYPPMKTRNGQIYIEGFFPDAPTPLYVSRGIGTTFFPSRLGCPPEVSVLTLVPG
jgi:predicted MPP superfamily phosphohydrolase